MKCKKCNQEMKLIQLLMFEKDGSDYWSAYEYETFYDEKTQKEYVNIETNMHFTGFALDDYQDELKESVRCPHCKNYPMNISKDIVIHNPVILILE